MPPFAVDLADIQQAAQRLAGRAHRTPVMTCATLDRIAGRTLFFKCEHLQKAGAFKFRGACNAVMRLIAGDRGARRGDAQFRQSRPGARPRRQAARHPGPHRHAEQRLAGQTPSRRGIRRPRHRVRADAGGARDDRGGGVVRNRRDVDSAL